MKKLMEFLKDEEGATAIEYGLMAALIAVVIYVMVANTGQSINNAFTSINTALQAATSGGG